MRLALGSIPVCVGKRACRPLGVRVIRVDPHLWGKEVAAVPVAFRQNTGTVHYASEKTSAFRCKRVVSGCSLAGVFVVLVLVVVAIEVENELTDLSHLAVCAFPTGSNLLSDVGDSGV